MAFEPFIGNLIYFLFFPTNRKVSIGMKKRKMNHRYRDAQDEVNELIEYIKGFPSGFII